MKQSQHNRVARFSGDRCSFPHSPTPSCVIQQTPNRGNPQPTSVSGPSPTPLPTTYLLESAFGCGEAATCRSLCQARPSLVEARAAWWVEGAGPRMGTLFVRRRCAENPACALVMGGPWKIKLWEQGCQRRWHVDVVQGGPRSLARVCRQTLLWWGLADDCTSTKRSPNFDVRKAVSRNITPCGQCKVPAARFHEYCTWYVTPRRRKQQVRGTHSAAPPNRPVTVACSLYQQ